MNYRISIKSLHFRVSIPNPGPAHPNQNATNDENVTHKPCFFSFRLF